MTQLEAVNLILRALSEHPVASLDIRHPSVTLALATLDVSKDEVLADNWWINKIRVTLQRESDNRVQYPADAYEFVPDKYQAIVRSGYLYNDQNQSFIFDEDVSGWATYELDWTDLPNAVQRMVAYRAAISAVSSDVGGEIPAYLQIGYATAETQVQSMHTRQRKFNARQRRSWWRYESARRG